MGADLGMRFGAKVLDFILLGLATVLLGSVLVLLSAAMHLAGSGLPWVGPRAWGVFDPGSASAVAAAGLYLAYFSVLEATRGQTVGKMVLRISVQGPDGGRPTLPQALLRNLWTAVGAVAALSVAGTLLSGLLWVAAVLSIAVTVSQAPDGRGWHDRLGGGTSVVRTPQAA